MRITIYIVLILFVVVRADKNGMQELLNNVLASSSENFDNYLCEEFKGKHDKLRSTLHQFENPRPVRKMLNLHNKNKHLEHMHRINKKHFQAPNMVTMPLSMQEIKKKISKLHAKNKPLHQIKYPKELSKKYNNLRSQGPVGPTGPTGPAGAAGPAGPAGADGKDKIDEEFKLYTIIADIILFVLLIFGYFSLVRCFKSANTATNTVNNGSGNLMYRPRIARQIGNINF